MLEIGCGDGAMAATIRRALPRSELLGIDPGVLEPGGMFDADREGVTFERLTSAQLIERGEPTFDLVMLIDVLHHVAGPARQEVLRDAATLCMPGGTVAIKEWEHRPGLADKAAFTADRFVSGDSNVRFMLRSELQMLIDNALAGWVNTCVARIPPRRANLLLTYRRGQSQ